jgi:hypothetical protein
MMAPMMSGDGRMANSDNTDNVSVKLAAYNSNDEMTKNYIINRFSCC